MTVTFIVDLTGWKLLAIFLIFGFGYPLHEFMHILPLKLRGIPYSVEFAPGDRPMWFSVLIGKMFKIEPAEEISPQFTILFALAPGILAIPGLYLWVEMFTYNIISLSSLLLVGVWIIVFLPSALDWKVAISAMREM